tara:strand:- start:3360 stop:4271 length:912 start_codon:yes stop_codon:yes gene_type:complete
MKKLLFTLMLGLFFLSCEKEQLELPNNNVVIPEGNAELIGYNWVLSDGRVYLENLDNNDKSYYDHFGDNQNISNLQPINGSDVFFDSLVQDITTWNFGNSNFTLNGEYAYEMNGTTEIVSINGLEDGSSRSLIVLELTEEKLTVRVGEGYASSNGSNYNYFSTLTFVRQGETCTSCQPNALYGYTYGGLISQSTEENEIVNTKWVVTYVQDGFANFTPNDTLHFINNNQYTINGTFASNYTLNGIIGNNYSELTLYNFYTIGGGDYSGYVPTNFISVGLLNLIEFSDIFNVGTNKKVSMQRIQ